MECKLTRKSNVVQVIGGKWERKEGTREWWKIPHEKSVWCGFLYSLINVRSADFKVIHTAFFVRQEKGSKQSGESDLLRTSDLSEENKIGISSVSVTLQWEDVGFFGLFFVFGFFFGTHPAFLTHAFKKINCSFCCWVTRPWGSRAMKYWCEIGWLRNSLKGGWTWRMPSFLRVCPLHFYLFLFFPPQMPGYKYL